MKTEKISFIQIDEVGAVGSSVDVIHVLVIVVNVVLAALEARVESSLTVGTVCDFWDHFYFIKVGKLVASVIVFNVLLEDFRVRLFHQF